MADSRSTSTLSDNSQISDPQFSFIWDHNFQESNFLNTIQLESQVSSSNFEFNLLATMSSDNESASPGTDLLTWEESTK